MAEIEYFGILASTNQRLSQTVPFEDDLIINDPVPVLSYLKDNYGSMDVFKCPAFTNHVKNTFYITSPIDFKLQKIGDEHWSVSNTKSKARSLSPYLDVKQPETTIIKGVPCMNFGLQYYFVNNGDNITMEIIQPPLVNQDLTNMPGEFTISKWCRPTNFTFYVKPGITELTFKRGDPLYAVRFKTDKRVTLTRIEDSNRKHLLLEEQAKATSLKDYYPGLKLEEMYNLFKRSMKRIFEK
jgi:hypothetical protein